MTVDIGAEAIDRDATYAPGRTIVNKANQAGIGGLITSIDIWAYGMMTGFRVGTFYLTGTNKLKCRASQAIPGTIPEGEKTTKVVSIAVEIGDYIGCYYPSGIMERDIEGRAGLWYKRGEYIDPADEATYTSLDEDEISLGGYITPPVVGWTGKISGVTNPAKVMGVDVANIKSVKSVE